MPCAANAEVYEEAIDDADILSKMKIITGRLQNGQTAFIATSIGLIRWQFLMEHNLTAEEHLEHEKSDEKQASDYDIIHVYGNQIECVMSETHAVYYTQENCEFIVINLGSFVRTHQIQIPANSHFTRFTFDSSRWLVSTHR